MCVFFFKQKTAYEMLRSLVGSEMCIRDRSRMMRALEQSMYIGLAAAVWFLNRMLDRFYTGG